MNPTARPVQPDLPPLTSRRARRNAEHVRAVRTGEIDIVPPARRRSKTIHLPVPKLPAPKPAQSRKPDAPPAQSQPASRATSRRARRAEESRIGPLDKVLAGVVVVLGLLMVFMGIAGLVTSLTHYQFDVFGFFNGGVTLIAGLAWTVVAPMKVLETS